MLSRCRETVLFEMLKNSAGAQHTETAFRSPSPSLLCLWVHRVMGVCKCRVHIIWYPNDIKFADIHFKHVLYISGFKSQVTWCLSLQSSRYSRILHISISTFFRTYSFNRSSNIPIAIAKYIFCTDYNIGRFIMKDWTWLHIIRCQLFQNEPDVIFSKIFYALWLFLM